MQSFYQKSYILYGFFIILFFTAPIVAQTVAKLEAEFSIKIDTTGRGTLEIIARTPSLKFYTRRVIARAKNCPPLERTSAKLPPDWKLRLLNNQSTDGNVCIQGFTVTFKDLDTLDQQLRFSRYGSLVKNGDTFTISLSRNEPKQPPAGGIVYEQTYIYSVQAPSIIKYSPTINTKNQENSVNWTYVNQYSHSVQVTGQLVKKDRDVCKRETDTRAATLDKIERARERLKENLPYILAAAKEFGVDPNTIAGALYSEWSRNLTEPKFLGQAAMALHFPELNPSNGLGQVKLETAIRLETLGVINASNNLDERINRLYTPQENLRYVAAYMKNLGDLFPQIKDNPTLLIHLYNIGEFKTKGDSNSGLRTLSNIPGYDCFAADAKAQFPYFESLINSLSIPK